MPRSMPRFALSRVKTNGPRLWNAKRRIPQSKGLYPHSPAVQELEANRFSQNWRSLVSQDVVDFIDKYEGRDSTGQPKTEMHPADKLRLLKSPSYYFSRPQNVPLNLRKQVHFPNFTITLLRTPHLGAYYASFEVPLWFGKLDLKSYLSNLYKVETLHIRSFVLYQAPERTKPAKKYSAGMKKPKRYRKKMTVQLVKPFMWPAELTQTELNSPSYEAKHFWLSSSRFAETNRQEQDPVPKKADMDQRKSLADQARLILGRKESWQPTWKQLEPSVKVMGPPPKTSRRSPKLATARLMSTSRRPPS